MDSVWRRIEAVITGLTRNFWKLRPFRPLKMSAAQSFARVRISQFHIVLACFSCIFSAHGKQLRYTEGYRRGHNENDSKSFDGQKPSVGSNPTPSASEKPSHIKALRPYDWAFLFANLPLLHMIFGKKSCLPSDGLGFRQGQDIVHDVCGHKLGLIVQMAVDIRRGADVAVTQPFLDLLHGHVVGLQQRSAAVPLRYNYDKPEKPRISRAFGYLARFFILFQTEKSSREVVIS